MIWTPINYLSSGSAGHCSIIQAELMVLNTGLRETRRLLNFHGILVEWDSFSIFRQASGEEKGPLGLGILRTF